VEPSGTVIGGGRRLVAEEAVESWRTLAITAVSNVCLLQWRFPKVCAFGTSVNKYLH